MQESDKIQVYDNQPIRTAWDEQNEEWYFSIVDVVSVLTDQPDRRRAGKYWSVLKTRLKKEGSQLGRPPGTGPAATTPPETEKATAAVARRRGPDPPEAPARRPAAPQTAVRPPEPPAKTD